MKFKSKPKEYLYNDSYGLKRIYVYTSHCDIRNILQFSPDVADQLWLPIPDYPGYEISDMWNIRSFKYLKQFHLGTLVYIDEKGNCEITDKNNIRRKVSKYDLMESAKNYYKINHPYGYPKSTLQSFDKNSARNQRKFIDNQAIKNSKLEKGVVRKPTPVVKSDNTLFTPKFTVVKNKDETTSSIKNPVFFIDSRYNNGENY